MIRRNFLKNTTAWAASASLIGTSQAWAGANDRIQVACFGMGGRGNDRMMAAAKQDGVEVVAVCDPDETRMQSAAENLEKNAGNKPKMEFDLRKLLENKDIDVVIITTCNHWHALGTIWSCQAGKHVYVEKPVNHRFREGRQMVEVARKYNRLVQGNQRRSDGLYKKAVQLLHDGVIGDIYMTRCFYYGSREPIGQKPKEPPEHIHWTCGWDRLRSSLIMKILRTITGTGSGTRQRELGNNGSHIIDVMRWGSNKKLPVKIHSNGDATDGMIRRRLPTPIVFRI